METVKNFINGQITESRSERFAPIYNPATGEQTRQVVLSSAAEVEQVVAVADAAFPAWAKTSPLKRARVMFK